MLAVTNVGGTDILTVGGTSATVNGTVSSNSLSVSGTVSGAGFNTLFASPPAIGGTTPAAGSFTTMSVGGTLTVSGGYTYLNGAAATNRFNMYQTAGVNRWGVGGAGDTESGGNTGTSFAVGRYTDAGAYIDEPLIISRATGLVSIIDGASVSNGLTVASGGIYLGSALAASVTDLSKHISLFGDTLGFSVTGGRLNTVVPAGMLAVTNVGGTDILTVASTGATVTNMTVTGTLTAASYVAPGATSNIGRNRIDNGNMEIAQRTLPVTVNNAYGLDRWIASWSSGTASVSQGAYGGYTSRKQLVLAITGLTSGTTAGAYHRIEAARSCDLAGQTVTVQFNATLTNTGTGGTFSVQPYYAGPLDNFAGNVAIGSPIPFTLSGTPVTYTATFAVPSAAVNGLQLNFLITQGTTGNIAFVITSVQLEAGAAATAFERLDPVLNLQRCQRFYVAKNVWGISYGLSGGTYGFGSDLPVFMHHLATVNVASGASYGNCSYSSITATASDKVALCVITGATGAYTANAIVTASSDL
jgi:hypothetical protein